MGVVVAADDVVPNQCSGLVGSRALLTLQARGSMLVQSLGTRAIDVTIRM